MAFPLKDKFPEDSEQDYRNLVDGLLCPLLVYTKDGPVYANAAWLSITDTTLENLLSVNNIRDLLQWIDIDGPTELRLTKNSPGNSRGQRVRFLLNTRAGAHMDAVQQAITWCGSPAKLLLVSSDDVASKVTVTDQQRLLDIAKRTKDWFWELDQELQYSWFSDNIETVMGYPPEWFYGRPRVDYVPGNELEKQEWKEHLAQMSRREPFDDFVFQMARRDGEVRWVSVSGAPFHGINGEFLGYRGTGSDVNDARTLEIALRHSEQRFREFADSASDWYWEMDENLRFTFITENVLERIGVPASYFIGKTRREIFGEDLLDDPIWAEHYELLARREPFRDFVYSSPDSAGVAPAWLRVSGSPVFSSDGQFEGYRGCATVITEQVEDQIAREKSENRFREFSELAADWFWELDADLKFSYISDRFHEICGVNPSRMIGRYSGDIESGYSGHQASEDPRAESIVDLLKRQQAFEGWQFNWKHPDGRVLRILVNARPIFDSKGTCSGHRGTATDVTQKYQLSKELEFRANHDVLTGLYNRREFDRHVQIALDRSTHYGKSSALLYIDLDQFKVVNDSVGHLAGDELIKRVSGLISSQVRTGDVVARLGGDEFGVLLNDCAVKDAMSVAGLIAETIREFTFMWDGQAFRISTSIGVVSIDESTESVTEILSQSDVACYAAKDAGRNRISRYESRDDSAKRQHNQILQAAGIRDSLDNDRFRLFKQVILPIDSSQSPLRFELLLRLLDHSDRILAPGTVIPAAERYGLMPSIDRWVLRTAIENLQLLRELHPGCVININLSGTTISDTALPDFVESLLSRFGVDEGAVCFEVTETALISNISVASSTIKSIKEMGQSFALDDFGSGMSSFAYLKHLPVDYLKIDGGFVRDIATDETDYAVVAAINDVAHRLGIETIAEFVENEDIVKKLREIGVDYGQGFGLGKPVPLDSVSDAIEVNSLTRHAG